MPSDGSVEAPAGFYAQVAPRTIRVAIVSDNRLLREGLNLLLVDAGQRAIVVAYMADLVAPLRRLERLAPEILLIDASGPAGIEMIQRAHRTLPKVKVIAFGLADAEPAILACAQAGMAGFVAPGASLDELVAAIRSAISGELVCSPRVAALLLRHVGNVEADSPAAAPAPLTRREREIAVLMGDGLSNKQIARTLGIKSATVKNHVHMILSKLRLKRRGEVAGQLLQGRLRGLQNLLGKAPPIPV